MQTVASPYLSDFDFMSVIQEVRLSSARVWVSSATECTAEGCSSLASQTAAVNSVVSLV